MRQFHDTLTFRTRGRGLTDITRDVAAALKRSGLADGACTLLVQHTSASLLVQENADASVQRDLEAFLGRLCPEHPTLYEHDAEGPDDMPAHLRAAVMPTSLTIPFQRGRLRLGTWQAVYLWEHRAHAHPRQLLVTLLG